MRNVLQFIAFQAVWFAAVLGAARGEMIWGPAAVLGMFLLHLRWARGDRLGETLYVLLWGVAGTLLDSLIHGLGLTLFPTSSWSPSWLAPPWIASLWFAFAMLPRFSLSWLRPHTRWAVILGAVGGPLSFQAGARLQATATGAEPLWTWLVLGLEYALIVPLMLRTAGQEPAEGP